MTPEHLLALLPFSTRETAPLRGARWPRWVVAALLLAGGARLGWRAAHGRTEPGAGATASPVVVPAVRAVRKTLERTITVAAELRPFQEVDIHPRVAGFLEELKVDIGDAVRSGQLLARIQAPELPDDIRRAEAVERRSIEEVRRSEAAHELTRLAHTRLAAVNAAKPNLIAQQDLDEALQKQRAAEAAWASAQRQLEVAQAELARLHTISNETRITAPFSGVITKRGADSGSLLAASANGAGAPPLLRLSQLDRLRCAFPVSMDYAPLINSGTQVTIEARNQPKNMEGVVSRIARRIETTTRTMDVEVDIDNPGLRLIPGVYASATIHLERKQGALSLPLEAVGRGKSPTVFAITDRRLIEERPVTLGLTTPADVEILSGIKEGDLVLTGSRGRVAVGQSVEPRVAAIP